MRNGSEIRRFSGCEKGSTHVEYLVLFGAIALILSVAIAAVGGPMLEYYRSIQMTVSAPAP